MDNQSLDSIARPDTVTVMRQLSEVGRYLLASAFLGAVGFWLWHKGRAR